MTYSRAILSIVVAANVISTSSLAVARPGGRRSAKAKTVQGAKTPQRRAKENQKHTLSEAVKSPKTSAQKPNPYAAPMARGNASRHIYARRSRRRFRAAEVAIEVAGTLFGASAVYALMDLDRGATSSLTSADVGLSVGSLVIAAGLFKLSGVFRERADRAQE